MATLTEGELLDFCKTPQRTRQLRFLRSMGLNPGVRDDGTIAITWEAINAAMTGANTETKTEGAGVNLHAI